MDFLWQKLSLRTALMIPFVFLVGYWSYRSGQTTVNDLGGELMSSISRPVNQNIQYYLEHLQATEQTQQLLINQGKLDIFNLTALEKYLLEENQLKSNHFDLLSFTNENGDFISMERMSQEKRIVRRLSGSDPKQAFRHYLMSQEGKNRTLLETRYDYDPHNDPPGNPWYAQSKDTPQGLWTVGITLSHGRDRPQLLVSHLQGLNNDQGIFQGVVVVGIYVEKIGQFLQSLHLPKQSLVVILEPNGHVLETSLPYRPFHFENKGTIEYPYLKMTDSSTPLLQAVGKQLRNQEIDLATLTQPTQLSFKFAEKKYFLQITPIPGEELNWLTIVVIPKSTLMTQIVANTHRTLYLSSVAFVGSVLVGWFGWKRDQVDTPPVENAGDSSFIQKP